jgi:hypothetical protein
MLGFFSCIDCLQENITKICKWALLPGNTEMDLITDQSLDEMEDLAEVLGRQGFTIYLHSLNHLLDR